jgi:PEP-CTERM motif
LVFGIIMTGKLFAAAIAATMAAASLPAHAGVIFDLSPTNNISPRPSDDGLGQGVSVSTTTTISGFSFFANLPDGGEGKFMIWEPTDDGDQTLLFSQTTSIAAADTPSWVSTTGNIDFTLDAGSTYYFGFIGDNFIDVGFLFPIVPYSANGLSAVETGNSNYNSFDTPTFVGGGGAEVGLQISVVATPEPSTWVMMGLGFASLGFAGWRAQRKTAALAA